MIVLPGLAMFEWGDDEHTLMIVAPGLARRLVHRWGRAWRQWLMSLDPGVAMEARVKLGLATQSFMNIMSASMAVEFLTGPTSRTKRMESPMLKSSTSGNCGSTRKSVTHARLLELL
jgi:hypothetical protein